MFVRIRNLREDNDLTQKQVSDYLFCDQSLYSKYERGVREVPISIIIKLAKYYGTSVDYIVGLTDNKKPYDKQFYINRKSLSELITQAFNICL